MKPLPLLFSSCLVLAATTLFADSPEVVPPANGANLRGTAVAFPPVSQPWTVVGTWDCTQRDWSGSLTLREDGSLFGPNNGLSGRWALQGQGGQINLVLYWNDWPAEIVTLLGSGEFQGNPARGNLRMRRHELSPTPITMVPPGRELGSLETRVWHQSEPPLKLIARDEGFCVLTGVTGRFGGSGEAVRVYIGADGYWYLGGQSQQEAVGGECLVIRYRK